MTAEQLPSQFGDLLPFLEGWDIPGTDERYRKRLDSSMDELQLFYDAVHGKFEAIKQYLDARSFEDYTQADRRLARLAFAYIVVAPAIEIFHQPAVPDCASIEMFETVREYRL